MDEHFATAAFEEEPAGDARYAFHVERLVSWVAPRELFCRTRQALAKLAPHIQQVAMESNGKGVTIDGDAGGLSNR